MRDWTNYYYFFYSGAALMLTLVGLWFTRTLPGLDRWSKRFFTALFALLMLYNLCAHVDVILTFYPSMALLQRAVWYVESLAAPLLLPMFTVFLLHCCGESTKNNRLLRTVCALWGVYFILLTVGQFTNLFYDITPDNQLRRSKLYSLGISPLLVILLLNLAGVLRRRDALPKRYYRAFLIYLLPLTLAPLIHLRVSVFALLTVGIDFIAVSMFGLILSDQIEKDLRQQREIAHQRASIMVLQMRPHFIYNTMTSIYCLCNQDAQKARQVTMDFTTYLRKNFNAIASDEPIPFSSELEHARAYLAVEQAQYEDSLFVEYDTPHTRFRVPPLTLQPIVENAVKHGRDAWSGPLHISVRSRDTDAGSEIIVEDDGSGYEPQEDSEPHIALKNIRQRLEMMCGGELTITPREGGGTVVKVTIPG